jgi:tetratricopeptide (TPR) repeat protein
MSENPSRATAVGRALALALACAPALLTSGTAAGHSQGHDDHAPGTVDFPVSCTEPAQAEFNRAAALLHHMTYPQAREAFEKTAAIDPACAMARWGAAMTLFQPLWPTRPSPADLARGFALAREAQALAPPSRRERLFIETVEAFFLDPASPDYWLRIRRWADATDRVLVEYPDDTEAAAFRALALLATAPSDAVSREHADRAAQILLRVYERNPDHPGAMHYLVHANDVPGRERELLEITRKYESAAPDNPHALHMPTHIYTRLGDWDGVIRGNLRAADAALRYPAGAHGEYVWDEFPHAIEYLVYASLQAGDYELAATQLARLRGTPGLEPTFKTAFHLASTQARYVLERHAWQEAERIVPREPATLDWDRFPWPEAISQLARGLGAAHLGRLDATEAVIQRLDALEAAARRAGEELFARNIRLLRLELAAWLAHMEGQQDASIALMQEAAALEVSTPKHAVTPAPTIPAHELLGDLLLELRRPAEALAAYRRSLELYPNRLNSLRGLERAGQAP